MKKFSTTSKTLCAMIVLITLLTMSCSTTRTAKKGTTPKARTVEILAVNDMHAALDNFPRFAFMADSLRGIYPHLLLVSGGDNQTGNPANDQYPQKGMPMIELMNAVKFDLSAVGNHEFDSHLEGFEHITHQANFDFLNANLVVPSDADFRIKPYKIMETPNGLKVVFVSLLDINHKGIPDSHSDNVKGFVFRNPFEAAQDYLFLKDSGDVFVMVNHMGFEEDVKLAWQLPAGTVDVIIGGHSHTKVDRDQIHNGVMITQAERKLKYATLITLTVTPQGEVMREMKLLDVGKKGNRSAEVQKMVDGYNDNPRLNEPIATASDDFASSEEVGYLMTDAIRAASGADIALVNPGGVRISNLDKGSVRVRDVFEMDPFGNEMVQFNLSGHEMRNLFLAAFATDEDRPIYLSGMTTRYLFDADGKLVDVKLMTTDGQPMDMDKMYAVVMNDYMALTYSYEHEDAGQALFKTTAETTIEYLRNLKNIPSYRGVKRVMSDE